MRGSAAAWLWAALLTLMWQPSVFAIECYICSWSPDDILVEKDRCSTGHFDENRVRTEDCNVGCEVVKMYDSNGQLTMFFRNCLMATHNKIPFEYNKRSSIMMEEEMFACDSDYCNSATKQSTVSLATAGAVLLPLLWARLA